MMSDETKIEFFGNVSNFWLVHGPAYDKKNIKIICSEAWRRNYHNFRLFSGHGTEIIEIIDN